MRNKKLIQKAQQLLKTVTSKDKRKKILKKIIKLKLNDRTY